MLIQDGGQLGVIAKERMSVTFLTLMRKKQTQTAYPSSRDSGYVTVGGMVTGAPAYWSPCASVMKKGAGAPQAVSFPFSRPGTLLHGRSQPPEDGSSCSLHFLSGGMRPPHRHAHRCIC